MTVSDVRRWVKAEWVEGKKAETVVMEPLQFDDVEASQMEVIRVPEVSGVSVRHHIRAGCSRHLLERLGLVVVRVSSPLTSSACCKTAGR
ncbi:MAG: hypothetical protein IPM61_16890 [Chlorobi bacterium]|nr:hypothetical protein [Chlorobiota bacterium]